MNLGSLARVSALALIGLSLACTPDNRENVETATATPSHPPRSYPVPGRPVLNAQKVAPPVMGAGDPSEPEALSWTKPDAWEDVSQPNPMRKATYRVKGKGAAPDAGSPTSDDAELAVSRAGGDVDSNVKRWAGQFKDAPSPKQSQKTVGDLPVTLIELQGTYAGMAIPGKEAEPKSGYALLAAIVETPKGLYFFKLTGPQKTVDGARPDFDKLVASFKKL